MTNNILNKDIILKQFSQAEIYLKFLGLNEFPQGNISSPFSDDIKPSFTLYKNGSFKCNSSGKQGDVFQFVAYKNNLDNRTQFKEVLQIIAIEMQLNCNNNLNNETKKNASNTPKNPNTLDKQQQLQQNFNENSTIIATKEVLKFSVNVFDRPFTNNDLKYWQNLGISIDVLKKYNVLSVAKYQFYSATKNKNFSFSIAIDKLCFTYQINQNFEVYVPAQLNHQQPKIFVNGLLHSDIFGLEQLHGIGCNEIIICAGKKDTLIMISRGFKAVCFRSETHHPTTQQIATLQSFCANLFICYDADSGGNTGMNAITYRFPFIKRIDLPPNENIKGYDLTDYFQQYTAEDFQRIIDNTVKK